MLEKSTECKGVGTEGCGLTSFKSLVDDCSGIFSDSGETCSFFFLYMPSSQ